MDDPRSRPGSIFIHVQPFLVQNQHDLILLDTGLGKIGVDGVPQILSNIRKQGFAPEEITKVILSHLHSDHSLGLINMDSVQLNFPNAMHYVQKKELEQALDSQNESYPARMLEYFKKVAQLNLLEGDTDLENGIEIRVTGGHSEFHQVISLHDPMSGMPPKANYHQTVFFGGDVLPEGIQLIRNYIAKYDFDGRKSMQLRKEFGQKAAKENWTCLYYHDNNPNPYSKVKMSPEGVFTLDY